MSAQKAKRVSGRKRDRNKPLRSRARTLVTKAREAIDGSGDSTDQVVHSAIVSLDRAAQKGAIHPRNAARRKSRLMQQLNKAGTE